MNTDWITCEDCLDVDGDIVACSKHTTEHSRERHVIELSMTKATERLRRAAKLVRETRGYPTNWRTEVGTRFLPVYADTEFEAKTMNKATGARGAGDDLDSIDTVENIVRYAHQTRRNGYVCHLYFTSTGYDGELVDVVTVWTGTETIPPVIIH